MRQVFISYSSTDRERAKRLAEAVEAAGYSVWWDRQIAPGEIFDEAIEAALNQSACVVVIWSSASVKSEWVKTEAAEAAKRKVLVPVLLDSVTIPLEFRRIQAADLTQWNGSHDDSEFQKFLAAIQMETHSARLDGGSQSAPLENVLREAKGDDQHPGCRWHVVHHRCLSGENWIHPPKSIEVLRVSGAPYFITPLKRTREY